jgi:hypothetical protein
MLDRERERERERERASERENVRERGKGERQRMNVNLFTSIAENFNQNFRQFRHQLNFMKFIPKIPCKYVQTVK